MIENYTRVSPGHWVQNELTGDLPDYSATYSKTRYDTYKTTDLMSKLRFDILHSSVGDFGSICDFGYGNGSFLGYCINQNKRTFGYDISDYPVPNGCSRINFDEVCGIYIDVVTFFDSIEHLQEKNLQPFLSALKAKHICVSVPWFHESAGELWFMNWKHRRENEHLHHFDAHGLVDLMVSSGYKIVHIGNDEDAIRKSVDSFPNILTVVATKNDI